MQVATRHWGDTDRHERFGATPAQDGTQKNTRGPACREGHTHRFFLKKTQEGLAPTHTRGAGGGEGHFGDSMVGFEKKLLPTEDIK